MSQTRPHGFTLIEVLVALSIVATALLAGFKASAALTLNAERQIDRVLAQVCAQNSLTHIQLTQQLPDIGQSDQPCVQSGRTYTLHMTVQPTPNPLFRRVEMQLLHEQQSLLQLNTVVGRY